MVKDKVLNDATGLDPDEVLETTLRYVGRDDLLIVLDTPGFHLSPGDVLGMTRKEARQLRNWLNKALEVR